MDSINDEQRSAIEEFDRPVLILAGPGTGKTRVVIEKIRHAVRRRSISPDQILALTFSRKAADEMLDRLASVLPAGSEPVVQTMHAFAADFLKTEYRMAGLRSGFRIASPHRTFLVAQTLFPMMNFRSISGRVPSEQYILDLIQFLSKLKDEDLSLDRLDQWVNSRERSQSDPEVRDLYAGIVENGLLLENALRDQNLVDFGELIQRAYRVLKDSPEVAHRWRTRFHYILVDEFQDCNAAQIRLVAALANGSNISVVGDDDQSIYRFRGASYAAFSVFKRLFPHAVEVALTKSYRLPSRVSDFASRLIALNGTHRYRPDKRVIGLTTGGRIQLLKSNTPEAEARAVADLIARSVRLKESDYSDWAVLVRANDHAEPLESEFHLRAIPYQIKGRMDPFDLPAVRELFLLAEFLLNPFDSTALYRLLDGRLISLSAEEFDRCRRWQEEESRETKTRLSLFELLRRRSERDPDDPLIRKLAPFLFQCRELLKAAYIEPVHLLFSRILFETPFLKGVLRCDVADLARTFEMVEFILKMAREYVAENQLRPTLEPFLKSLHSRRAIRDWGEVPVADAPVGVQVMTIHSAKGLEFRNVVIYSLAQRRFPAMQRTPSLPFPEDLCEEEFRVSDEHRVEERRLFYVALTRAQESVVLSALCRNGEPTSAFLSKDLADALSDVETVSAEEESAALNDSKAALSRMGRAVGALIDAADPDAALEAERELRKVTEHWFRFRFENERPGADQSPAIGTRPRAPSPSFSFSQFEAYETCPRQYEYSHLLRIPQPESATLGFGNIVHATLERFVREWIAGEMPDEQRLLKIYAEEWTGLPFKSQFEEERYKSSGREELIAYLPKLLASIRLTVAVEQTFTFGHQGRLISGKIDRIDRDGDRIVLVDYKTGKPKSQKEVDVNLQFSIYALACLSMYGRLPESISVEYLMDRTTVTTARTEAALPGWHEELDRRIAEIEAGVYTPTPGWCCRSCGYNRICDAAKL